MDRMQVAEQYQTETKERKPLGDDRREEILVWTVHRTTEIEQVTGRKRSVDTK